MRRFRFGFIRDLLEVLVVVLFENTSQCFSKVLRGKLIFSETVPLFDCFGIELCVVRRALWKEDLVIFELWALLPASPDFFDELIKS